VFLRIRDDQTHTAHCTQHTTIQASINRNSTMVSTHIRSAEGRKTHTHTRTDGRTRSQNIGNLVLSVCARLLKFYNMKIRGFFVGSPLFSPGILNSFEVNIWKFRLNSFQCRVLVNYGKISP
jgi:hypothetical protein